MKFRYFLIVVPLALVLVGCGKKSSSTAATQNTTTPGAVVPVPTIPTNPTGPAPTGPTTGGSGSCYRSVITSPIYTPTVNGTGSGSAYVWFNTTSGRVSADQDLRVQLIPNGSGATSGAGGTQGYTMLAADVTLLEDGYEVSGARFTAPTQTGYGQYYGGTKNGLKIGVKSQIIDFSSFLRSGHQYSFKISNVMSDKTCRDRCNSTYYNMCAQWYGNANLYPWCPQYPDYNMIYQCMQLQCDVGPVSSSAGWSATLNVETDTTPCLTP